MAKDTFAAASNRLATARAKLHKLAAANQEKLPPIVIKALEEANAAFLDLKKKADAAEKKQAERREMLGL
jgi:hypothetical protein